MKAFVQSLCRPTESGESHTIRLYDYICDKCQRFFGNVREMPDGWRAGRRKTRRHGGSVWIDEHRCDVCAGKRRVIERRWREADALARRRVEKIRESTK